MADPTTTTQAPPAAQAANPVKSAKAAAKAAPAAPTINLPAGATQRNRAKAVPKAVVAPTIPAGSLVKYQTTNAMFMLPVKCGGKFTFVKADKAYPFDKSKIKKQMMDTITAAIKAGRLKEVG